MTFSVAGHARGHPPMRVHLAYVDAGSLALHHQNKEDLTDSSRGLGDELQDQTLAAEMRHERTFTSRSQSVGN
ncbi:hypothetical protein [Methylobacterium nodulans]|uniref:hypothetical protein n=1 Tax=Methylobacterium nodulans TaxID=114616 RepID=UPI0005C15061|nr:hypothetical protein [Methylobacterium nodulans]